MRKLIVDFITSLDGYASAEGWPGWWGLEGPEYLGWLGEQPDGATGAERIYDGYPDVALDMIASRTFDGRTQLVEYRPRVLEHPPLEATA